MRRHLLALAFSFAVITISLYVTVSQPIKPSTPRVPHINQDTRQLLQNHTFNNTLVVVPVNDGMMFWADNMLCSLKNTTFDASKIVFWALDQNVKATLERRGFNTYYDPSLYSVSTYENLHYDTADFKKMMLERPKFFLDILHTGFDILFLDADTLFLQSPLLIPDRAVDIVFSTDSREFYTTKDAFRDVWRRGPRVPPVCNGVFWMKSNEFTIKLWQDMLNVFESGWRTYFWRLISFKDDQRGMDVLLNDGRARLVEQYPTGITSDMLLHRYSSRSELNVRLLDQTQVVSGHLLKNRRKQYDQNLAELQRQGRDRISIHLNWDPKQLTKEKGAKEMGLWLLDEEGKCQHR